MDENKVELDLYHECLYEIKQRIDIIRAHLMGELSERYVIFEVEFMCLQFRKILEKIALMSLVANKEIYAEQNEKFRKHYHAERIMNDLERINPLFYPKPITMVEKEDNYPELKPIEDGYLTKEEFVKIYEKCGAMMHAQNPFTDNKTYALTVNKYREEFREWIKKIYVLVSHHEIMLVGEKAMVVGVLNRADTGLPQAVILSQVENE